MTTENESEAFDFDDVIEDRHPRRIAGPGSYDSNNPSQDDTDDRSGNEDTHPYVTNHVDKSSSWISRDMGRELGEGLYPPGNTHGLSDPFSASAQASGTPRLPERTELAHMTSLLKQRRRETQNHVSPSPHVQHEATVCGGSIAHSPAGPSKAAANISTQLGKDQEEEVEYEEYSATGEVLRHYGAQSSGKSLSFLLGSEVALTKSW